MVLMFVFAVKFSHDIFFLAFYEPRRWKAFRYVNRKSLRSRQMQNFNKNELLVEKAKLKCRQK